MRARSVLASLLATSLASTLLLDGRRALRAECSGRPRRARRLRSPSLRDVARAPELEAAVRSLVNDRRSSDAQIGVVLVDCETGNVLAQAGEHVVVNPASNAKLYTAAAALAILHGSHRYQTTLSGTIKSGAATGLVLRGHGDPSLRTQDLWAMVQELKAHGVRRVEGDIVVDQRFFDEQTTPPAFEQQPNEWAAFRAPVSAVARQREQRSR